jgi:hypothetical protein
MVRELLYLIGGGIWMNSFSCSGVSGVGAAAPKARRMG